LIQCTIRVTLSFRNNNRPYRTVCIRSIPRLGVTQTAVCQPTV